MARAVAEAEAKAALHRGSEEGIGWGSAGEDITGNERRGEDDDEEDGEGGLMKARKEGRELTDKQEKLLEKYEQKAAKLENIEKELGRLKNKDKFLEDPLTEGQRRAMEQLERRQKQVCVSFFFSCHFLSFLSFSFPTLISFLCILCDDYFLVYATTYTHI